MDLNNINATETGILWQYTIVSIILLAVSVWIIVKLIKKSKNPGNSSCCGCSLSEQCEKKKIKNTIEKHGKHNC